MSLYKAAQSLPDQDLLDADADVMFMPSSLSVADDGLEALLGLEDEDEEEDEDEDEGKKSKKDDDKDEKENEAHLHGKGEIVVQIGDEDPVEKEFAFILPLVPGGEIQEEVEEEDVHDLAVEEEEDIQVEEPDPLDWRARGVSNYMEWLDQMMKNIPRHSGYDTSGLERAIAYLEMLDRSISQAVRLDVKGELDIGKLEQARYELRQGISRLNDRLQKVNYNKYKLKSKSLSRKAEEENEGLVKEAQKITGVKGVMITVPLLISHIARLCINATVSSGKDMEDTFTKLAKKYSLSMREKAETVQLLSDMGFPLRHREVNFDEDFDMSSTDNTEYIQNFPG